MGKIRTMLNISASTFGAELHEFEAEIAYTVQRGCQQTYTQPGEDDTISLTCVEVIDSNGNRNPALWLIGLIEDDRDIQGLCILDWCHDQIAAEEYRAEARREDRMLERGQ